MIKCKVNKKRHVIKVKASGDVYGITTETLAMIQTLHKSILEKNVKAAAEFRRLLMGVLLDPNSPIFKKGADLYE